MKKALINLS